MIEQKRNVFVSSFIVRRLIVLKFHDKPDKSHSNS